MRLLAFVAAQPAAVEVGDDPDCKDCDSDDGPWPAVIVIDGAPTCSRCLHELTLVGP